MLDVEKICPRQVAAFRGRCSARVRDPEQDSGYYEPLSHQIQPLSPDSLDMAAMPWRWLKIARFQGHNAQSTCTDRPPVNRELLMDMAGEPSTARSDGCLREHCKGLNPSRGKGRNYC